MDEVLKKLGISLDGEFSKDGSYIADIYNSDEFGRVYSVLEKNDNVEELYSNSLLTMHNSSISYLYDNYQITLIADFEQDLYKLVISEYEYVEDEENIDDYEEDEWKK